MNGHGTRRWLRSRVVVVIAAFSVVALLSAASCSGPGSTTTGSACHTASGVTVVVDMTAFGSGVHIGCATNAPTTGVAALQAAGFTPTGTANYGLAFVCRIDGKPAPAADPCMTTPPVNVYWAYYHAKSGATTWTKSSLGASTYAPPAGSIDAWAFGASAPPSITPAAVRAT